MTFNELRRLYPNYKFRTSSEEWLVVVDTKGNCLIDYNIDDYDEEIYFDVLKGRWVK